MPLSEGQLVNLPLNELRKMPMDALLRRMAELGYAIEGIKNKTQALTRFIDNAVEVSDGELTEEV
jgi:hypothetical protein